MAFKLRKAVMADVPALDRLIALSARSLGLQDYTEAQIAAALGSAWGVDTELIADGTYFVAEDAYQIIACGGWSWRGTLFGGDRQPGRQSRRLDPDCDAARIRAFFVHPAYARQGIGRALLARCEAEAWAHGFRAAELVATLTGQKLYRICGYVGEERTAYSLADGVTIDFVSMRKELTQAGHS